ncbi:MAG TPA: formate dehydrogenase subunit alpha, partial [Ilumatobacteraceae bacterium]|nr:formate dehydrogenase subunit alpha [Ilumatobacteraceae bacterium]
MTVTQEPDYGTPRSPDTDAAQINLTIDGAAITAPAGTSVLRAALEAGIEIPKLCATDRLGAFGSCRMCLVEIDGRKGTPASCTTPVAHGMQVATQTDKVQRLRRNIAELYLSDHTDDCAGAPDCELHEMAEALHANPQRYRVDTSAPSHGGLPIDTSNPYFRFDSSACIVCSRCVRACADIQGTFALTIAGRGMDSRVAAGIKGSFMDSDCVSCGACVQVCPTTALIEKPVVELGQPERSVDTTCAYCGVGCSFRAELRGDTVVRMTPLKAGGANEGHSCVKGRFAWGYTFHEDRITTPMIRDSIDDPWTVVSWDEAIAETARRLMAIKDQYGAQAIGGITSSRCTNEEVWVMQKVVRMAFATNNVDTCARVCHSPTGYGLNTTFGTSAGTQDFRSVDHADVILLIGANPTDAHPVFGSRIKHRLRQGAEIIVIDPRRIDLVRSTHVRAAHHLQLLPGTNVAVVNALAHVIVTEGLVDRDFVEKRCDMETFEAWCDFVARPENSPEATEQYSGVPAADLRAAARLYATGGNAAIYYGLGVTEHSQGSTMVMGMANLAMATGNIGREGVGVNPLRGQNNVQGSCDMGSFPHEFSGYRHVSDDATRAMFEAMWGTELDSRPGLRIPNMFDYAIDGAFRGLFVQGEDIAQSDPNTAHVVAALRSLDVLIVQDLFINETAKYAHIFLPGTSFLEKNGTFTNSERRINRVRPAMPAVSGKQEWEILLDVAAAMGTDIHYDNESQIMDEIAALTPTFAGVSFAKLDEVGSVQWPCNQEHPLGSPIMHTVAFSRGKGLFVETPYVPSDERSNRRFPLLLTTGRILSQYNVGAQTRRTQNLAWHDSDVLEIHPADAAERGIVSGRPVTITSRVGTTVMPADVTDRVPQGVVYTTFHHPERGANVITTEASDWA